MKLALSYVFFALIATAMNIAGQAFVVKTYDGRNVLILSVIVGTGVGLFVKYWLDKRYIFRLAPKKELLGEAGRFLLYGVMGVFTTAIFWGMEFLFHHLFHSDALRYIGAAIGLLIGYFIKYRLDQRFVFSGGA